MRDNRLYNYWASDLSRTYQYTQDKYSAFVFPSSGEMWYRRIRNRAGFAVTEPVAET